MTDEHQDHEIASLASDCAKCGACTAVCPVYLVTGRESLTARGRLHLLSRSLSPRSRHYGTIFSACLLCGACADVCPRHIDTLSLIIRGRKDVPLYHRPHEREKAVARSLLSAPALLAPLGRTARRLHAILPQSSGLRRKLALLIDEEPEPLQKPSLGAKSAQAPSSLNYFSGCLARFLQPSIAAATGKLAQAFFHSPLSTPDKQYCCGLASHCAGDWQEAQRLARKNIETFSNNEHPILTSCASCSSHLRSYPALLGNDRSWRIRAERFAQRVREFSSFFEPLAEASPLAGRFKNPGEKISPLYHDPCHLRFGPEKIIAAPRRLITKLSGIAPIEALGGSRCCGQGGLFHLGHPDLSRTILSGTCEAYANQFPTHIVTTCSGCLLQLRRGTRDHGINAKVLHLAVFLQQFLNQERQEEDAIAPPAQQKRKLESDGGHGDGLQ